MVRLVSFPNFVLENVAEGFDVAVAAISRADQQSRLRQHDEMRKIGLRNNKNLVKHMHLSVEFVQKVIVGGTMIGARMENK